MRLVVSLLTCITVSAMIPALADPAPNDHSANTATPASPAAASPAPASATPAAPAAATPAPAAAAAAAHPAATATQTQAINPGVEVDAAQMDQLEKHFLSEGYKIEMHNGEKYYCRREDQLGSRLGGQKQCSSAQQLMFIEKDARRQTEQAQHNQTSSPK